MNGMNTFGMLGQVISRLGRVRARTWALLAAVALVFFGLLLWAGVAALSWLWGQSPMMAETGKRFMGEAATQIEQVAGVSEAGKRLAGEATAQLEQASAVAETLTQAGATAVAVEAGRRLVGDAATQIEQVAPGLKEQVDQWVPGLTSKLPADDVSGSEVGPVPRFPGLVRSQFTREGSSVEVRYVGHASLAAVLAHYVQGYTAAGYAQEVLSATAEGEQHRFLRGEDTIDLTLLRRPGGVLEIGLKQSSP